MVLALCGLILLLLVVFGLVLHGQNRKYKSCGTGATLTKPLRVHVYLRSPVERETPGEAFAGMMIC